MNKYYEVQVRTINTSNSLRNSDWSESVFVYITHDPVPQHLLPMSDISTQIKAIGLVRVAGFRAAHDGNSVHAGNDVGVYSYVICNNTLPQQVAERNQIITEIENGINVWHDSTGGMVQGVHYTNNGITRSCNNIASGLLRNKIFLRDTNQLVIECGFDNAADAVNSGCVDHNPDPVSSADGKIETTDIYLYEDASLEDNSMQCSRLMRLSMHESGHAFGLADGALMPGKSVMRMPDDDLCVPTAHDIAAIKAIYQSRSSTQSSSAPSSNGQPVAPATTSTTATTTIKPTTSLTTTTSTTIQPTTAALTTTTTASTTTTSSTTSSTSTTATTTANRPVTVWQIEMRPSSHQTGITIFVPTSGNTFTYAGRNYTIKEIKVVRRGARIQATPDIEDGLPGGTLLRFWATDTPDTVQTLRLSDATEQGASHQWDIIWKRDQHPVDVDRNITWHIDLTIPVA